MKRAIVRVNNELGLHSRPAALFVKTAGKFESDITIKRDFTEANAKSMLNVLGMGIKYGTELEICAQGSDEEAAVMELVHLVEGGLN